MALTLTHRFNWMGYEGTESEALNLALLRPGDGVGNMRYTDYKYRQEVVSEIRMRLKLIKRDLGLLPPEEAEEMKGDEEEEEVVLDSDAEESERTLTARTQKELAATNGDMATRLAEQRQAMLGRGKYGDSDDDEDLEPVFLYPTPPTDAEVAEAARKVATGVRAALVSRGEVFVSYLDGREFLAAGELRAHNEARRASVAEKLDAEELPAEGEFDLTAIEAAVEKKNQCRMKLDALRCENDPTYASWLPADERDNTGKPVTNVAPEDGDEPTLTVKLNAAKAELAKARAAYNKRASECAKRLNTAIINKPEKEEEQAEELAEEQKEVEEEREL